jgi:PAS domain-containing protein
VAEADGDGVGEATGGDVGKRGSVARAGLRPGGEADMETRTWLEWPPADTLAAADQSSINQDGAHALAEAIVDTIREPFLVLDKDLCVVTANRSFYLTFVMKRKDVEGRPVYALGNGQWSVPELLLLLKNIAPHHAVMEAYEVEQEFPGLGRRTMLLNARKVFYEDNNHTTILLGIEDITDQRAKERELRELLQRKDLLLQEMQHRVANSLQIIASILLIKARTVRSEETRLHLQDAHQRVMSVAAMQQQLQGRNRTQSSSAPI